MIKVPMRSKREVKREQLLSINREKVQTAKNKQTMEQLNHGRNNNSIHTSLAQEQSSGSAAVRATRQQAETIRIPVLQKTARKGQKVALTADISLLEARFGWNTNNASCDVDVSAFLLDETGRVLGDDWFVFYGQRTSPDQSVVLQLAELEDREVIQIHLAKLDQRVKRIVFVLTIDEALRKNLHFDMLRDAYVRLLQANNHTELVSFKMEDYYDNVTSMMIGELYQYKGAWKFYAVGNGVDRDLAGICALYGVEVSEG